MANIQRFFPAFQILLFVFSVHGHNSKYQIGSDTIKRIYSFKQNFNISNVFSEMLLYNSTENYKCLNELNAIANGLTNFDEWAIQSKYMISICFLNLYFYKNFQNNQIILRTENQQLQMHGAHSRPAYKMETYLHWDHFHSVSNRMESTLKHNIALEN